MHSLTRGRWILLLAGLALPVGACTTQRVDPDPTGGMAAMGPMLSVERFLQAANARDFDAMRRLFGTVDGPIRGNDQDIELRMATLAEILRHDDYRIDSEDRAPGRRVPTIRIGVTLTQGREVIRDVPFMVVQTEEGRWMVQEIDIVKITGG